MIDNWGHLGGLIFGIFLGFVFVTVYNENDGLLFKANVWKIIGIASSLILFLTFTISFFTLRHPKI
jgi:hypothetical protein